MRGAHLVRRLRRPGTTGRGLLLLGLALLLVGCSGGGDSGSLTPASQPNASTTDSAPEINSAALEQQATQNLVELYRTAILQEDIDRLQAVLDGNGGAFAGGSFLDAMADIFRRHAVIDLQLSEVEIQGAPTPQAVTFQEALSVIDPAGLAQRTQVGRTRWQLGRRMGASGVVTILIAGVAREGPQFEVVMRGRVVAELPTRVEVRENTGTLTIVGGEVEVPETGEVQALVLAGNRWHGIITPPANPAPGSLRVRLRGAGGETIVLSHRYRLRVAGEGVLEPVGESGTTNLFAVAVAPDGTVWAGGRAVVSGAIGTILRVAGDGHTILPPSQPILEGLPARAVGRIEDLVVDRLGRMHSLFIASIRDEQGVEGIADNGDVVHDPREPDVFCPTVDVFAPTYPLRIQGEASPSTRMLAAAGGDGGHIWLLGSDAGVARVADAFRDGLCPESGVEVRYDRIFRRGESALLSNAVPALVESADGTLWFGTAFGLTQLRDGRFTAVPFDRTLSLRGDVATLEAFFQAVAQAIFDYKPLSAVEIRGVSFVDHFGSPLVKEDAILSLAEDGQGRLWVGTLGGGIRRIDMLGGSLQETLHLSRVVRDAAGRPQEGLGSNIIFALAVGPDGSIWGATEEGVSRVQEEQGRITITNFSPLDGLGVPVRDVAVGRDGTVWLATDEGLFRLTSTVGLLRGVVRDAAGRPVVGADVLVVGTPFHAVTDADGSFVLMNLPAGSYALLVDGSAATGGPFTAVMVEADVGVTAQELAPVVVAPRPPAAGLRIFAGDGQTGSVGRLLTQPLEVLVEDGTGRGIGGVPVTFTLIDDVQGVAGRAALTPELVITDSAGVAATTVSITTAGPIRVEASVAGLEAVVFTLTGLRDEEGGKEMAPRLIRVSGYNQSGQPGQVLPEPFVVRLEDQFGNPLPGQPVTAEITHGEGALTSAALQTGSGRTVVATTDLAGEARFNLQAGAKEEFIVVQISALGQTVHFLAIVGSVDIDTVPLDLAVAGEMVYVAAGFSGLQVVNASDPTRPEIIGVLGPSSGLEGVVFNVAVDGSFAYVATYTPTRFYVLDINDPTTPIVRSDHIELDASSTPVKIELDGTFAYVALSDRSTRTGSLLIIDVADPTKAARVGALSLPNPPKGLAVAEHFAYIPAGTSGVLVINVQDPAHPAITSALTQGTATFSGIVIARSAAYLIESEDGLRRLRVLDLSTPGAPVARGAARIQAAAVPFTASTIAIAGDFAYVASFDFGLQAFDIRTPDNPKFVGGVATPSAAFNVAARVTPTTSVYITDLAVGLHIVEGPPVDAADSDGDGVIDFFDAFPRDPTETLDTDRDGIGDHADADDDNDGFDDAVETAQGTDPLNPKDFPISFPQLQANNTLVVAAAAPKSRHGDGSFDRPYPSISAGLRGVTLLRDNNFFEEITVLVKAGTYTALQTLESFPLLLRDGRVTLRGGGLESTIIDAAFFADVLDVVVGHVAVEGFTLRRGVNGVVANIDTSAPLEITQNQIVEHLFTGVSIGLGGHPMLSANQISNNGFRGVELFELADAEVSGNSISNNGEDGLFLFRANARVGANLISNNAQEGIQLDEGSSALIVANQVRANNTTGILVSKNSEATINGNFIAENRFNGVTVQDRSYATIGDNEIFENGILSRDETVECVGAGILISRPETNARLVENHVGRNGFGIVVQQQANAEMRANIIEESGCDGVAISGALATINEGIITGNGNDGILLKSDDAGNIAMASIALEGAPLRIAFNGDDGIDIKPGSEVELNFGNILFEGNVDRDVEGTL